MSMCIAFAIGFNGSTQRLLSKQELLWRLGCQRSIGSRSIFCLWGLASRFARGRQSAANASFARFAPPPNWTQIMILKTCGLFVSSENRGKGQRRSRYDGICFVNGGDKRGIATFAQQMARSFVIRSDKRKCSQKILLGPTKSLGTKEQTWPGFGWPQRLFCSPPHRTEYVQSPNSQRSLTTRCSTDKFTLLTLTINA